LKTFKNFNVRGGSCTPELNAVGPDRLENRFVEEEFVYCGQLRSSAKQPMHFGEGEAKARARPRNYNRARGSVVVKVLCYMQEGRR
jgi:hypothetical protein